MRLSRCLLSLPLLLLLCTLPSRAQTPAAAPEDAGHYVEFVMEDDANCMLRDGQHVLVHSTHPSRTVRVWLDRYFRGVGTGDRSRSDLPPHGENEALGCSKVGDGVQEWRIVRAIFLD